MIAISSHRPFKDCPEEIVFNQFDAKSSWDDVFTEIIYFGEEEPDFKDDHTTFIPSDNFPTIKQLILEAAKQPYWSVLINADIQVMPNLNDCHAVALSQRANAMVSRRWEIPESGDLCRAKIVDNGLDFFAATAEIWALAAKEIPETFRIGHPMWDTWMLGFFTVNPACSPADITPARVIYHPKHANRVKAYEVTAPTGDKYLDGVRWPKLKIGV